MRLGGHYHKREMFRGEKFRVFRVWQYNRETFMLVTLQKRHYLTC